MEPLDRNNSTINFQQNMFLEMMKEHISNGLPYHYDSNCANQQNSDDGVEDEEIPIPIVYKKRVRVKFTPEQLDVLETTFQQHHYPTIDMIDDLVEQMNLPTQKITVWFQNRRARSKKNQQKFSTSQSFDADNQQHYDSGIHLDEDTSRASSTSPPSNLHPHVSPIGYLPPPSSPYYLPNSHPTPPWQNFRYPFPSYHSPYEFINYNNPFVFQDISNYPYYHG